ncbi:hypothetical protein C482_00660 [Natrialba chahannaoensis JCM 10990]|uniref:Uncharacterized protein n=1 Tax=Natrialba chahannaoensis JCM 10990 TaxID=1227492 RepID=M0B7M9_9EURY|nr:hypothetical protein C482_00660 [Natrialba chahannaoensis JCM 10990]
MLEALRKRRSRRFSTGIEIEGGPTAYTSDRDPQPLTETETALLVFAACGITGPPLLDWTYNEGEGGNMMAGLAGRTISSADAVNSMAMFVIQDDATWLARRPQDIPADELVDIMRLIAEDEFVEAWRRMRVKVADERCALPVEPPYNINANQWSLHAEGTTYFLPVSELTHLYINALFEFLREESGFYFVDERRLYLPAGLSEFAKSNGGFLDDDPNNGKVMTINYIERLAGEASLIEQGMALQNLGLACQAMGLSGFPHFTHHDEAWFEALGFRMGEQPLTEFLSVPRITAALLRLRGQNPEMSYPLGLEQNSEVLLKPFCPPYYDSMGDAVRAVYERKFGDDGIFRGGHDIVEESEVDTGWESPEEVTSDIPDIDESAIDATTAYCEYIHDRYGRFPATYPPFHTFMGFQAGHIDEGFYEEYYRPGALTESHRQHRDRWHDQYESS